MRFVCSRPLLVNALQTVERAVPTRETAPGVAGIRVRVREGRLTLFAANLDFAVETEVPARDPGEGEVVLDARYFSQLCRKLTGDEVTVETEGEGTARIESGSSVARVRTLVGGSLRELVPLQAAAVWELDGARLRAAVRRTAFAAAEEDTRVFLTGVWVQPEGSVLNLAATDGSRLAWNRVPLEDPGDGEPQGSAKRGVILPAQGLNELARLLQEGTRCRLLVGEREVFLALPGTRCAARVIEGQFPDYRAVVPANHVGELLVDRASLLAAVERAALIVRDGPAVVVLELGEEGLRVNAQEGEVGEAHEVLDGHYEGEPLQIAFQARFLTEPLRVLTVERVRLRFSGASQAATLTALTESRDDPLGEGAFVYVAMPIRMG